MTWRRAILSEIARRIDQAFAKMMLPQAVDHHTRRERIGRVGNPFCQRKTSLLIRCEFMGFGSLRRVRSRASVICVRQAKLHWYSAKAGRLDDFAFLHRIAPLKAADRVGFFGEFPGINPRSRIELL